MDPTISIGLPVYNGEDFLALAIESLLAQTFGDLELILSDNGSTDRTAEICRDSAGADRRIRYYPNTVNRGAAWNFNRVFELSRGRYFKWAAHDDLHDPTFLARCLAELEERPEVVLCATKALYIDASGNVLGARDHAVRMGDQRAHIRFRDLICVSHGCLWIFGLIRSNVLRGTSLMGNYDAADQVLLAELALRGPLHEIPDRLFFHRQHPLRSTLAYPTVYCRSAWYDPGISGRTVWPRWRLLREYARVIRRSELDRRDKALCRRQLLPWLWKKKKRLIQDLTVRAKSLLRGRERYYGPTAGNGDQGPGTRE